MYYNNNNDTSSIIGHDCFSILLLSVGDSLAPISIIQNIMLSMNKDMQILKFKFHKLIMWFNANKY